MRTARWLLAACGLMALGAAPAHELEYEVERTDAVIVDLSLSHGAQSVPYELYAPGGETPHQVGRSDAEGRVAFRPEEPGTWRLEVATEDGHGLKAEIEVDETGAVSGGEGEGSSRWLAVGAGLGYLLGFAGLLFGWQQRALRRRGA